MKDRNRSVVVLLASCIAGAVVGIGILSAQPAPSVKRSVLLKQDTTIAGREVVMAAVELPPGAAEGRHTHPAEVYAFVQEGTITLEIEGKPTVTLKAGDIFTIAPGQIHQAINIGSTTARLSAVFIAEKGKPLTTPVK
jgi:quercetin dioxygenase-like cupin family protein